MCACDLSPQQRDSSYMWCNNAIPLAGTRHQCCHHTRKPRSFRTHPLLSLEVGDRTAGLELRVPISLFRRAVIIL